MQVLFVSDIHIDLSKEVVWEMKRVNALFDILQKENFDKIVLGGDIFERANPSMEEISLFYTSVQKLHDVIVIAGNHEDGKNRTSTFDHLPDFGYEYLPTGTLTTDKTDIYFCSHYKLQTLKHIRQTMRDKQSILFTHVRCAVPPHIKEEFPCDSLSRNFDLVISGDIHQPYKPFDNFMYPGQPYSHTYKKAVDHTYFIIDTDTLEVTSKQLHLPCKVKVQIEIPNLKTYPFDKSNLYKVKVVGSIEELHKLPDLPINIQYEKTIKTETSESVAILNTKLDIVATLLTTTKEMYSLSDEVMEVGEDLIHSMVQP